MAAMGTESERLGVVDLAAATLDALRERSIAVLGFGSQGEPHALNLRDSGLNVIVGQRPGPRAERAQEAGFEVMPVSEAARRADLLIYGLPDDAAAAIHAEQVAPVLCPGQTLGFIHGFVIHYRRIVPPPDVDVVMVAPKAQGRGVRSEFVAGRGVLSLLAVHQDATGRALPTALAWAAGIGSVRAGILRTTFADETETDLFGEQAVLCGGLSALIHAGFDTLVEAGYPPELAYFECCHEIKLLADLINESGVSGMRERISSTARYGDLTRGPRIIDSHVRAEMRRVLDEIRSGAFARELAADFAAGGQIVRERMEADRRRLIEQVGATLRELLRRGVAARSSSAGGRQE